MEGRVVAIFAVGWGAEQEPQVVQVERGAGGLAGLDRLLGVFDGPFERTCVVDVALVLRPGEEGADHGELVLDGLGAGQVLRCDLGLEQGRDTLRPVLGQLVPAAGEPLEHVGVGPHEVAVQDLNGAVLPGVVLGQLHELAEHGGRSFEAGRAPFTGVGLHADVLVYGLGQERREQRGGGLGLDGKERLWSVGQVRAALEVRLRGQGVESRLGPEEGVAELAVGVAVLACLQARVSEEGVHLGCDAGEVLREQVLLRLVLAVGHGECPLLRVSRVLRDAGSEEVFVFDV